MKWGFVSYDGKPIINARSETALEKPMFRESMIERRCLIPASGYYEWKKDGSRKTKHRIYLPDGPIYFAGCYRQEKDSPVSRYVILTRQAVQCIEFIHERMPVVIPKAHVEAWLHEGLPDMEFALEDLLYEVA